MLEAGQKVRLLVDSLAFGGDGVARYGGFTLFVPGTAPLDEAEARVVEMHKNYGRAAVERILKPSPDRVEPVCPVAGICGGCPWQHLSMNSQLESKQRFLRDALERIGGFSDPPVRKIFPCDDPFHYRNKAVLAAANVETPRRGVSTLEIGFYAAGSHRVVPLPGQGCAVQSAAFNETVFKLQAGLDQAGLKACDEKTGLGQLRHVALRTASDGSVLAALVTREKLGDESRSAAGRWLKECPRLKGVVNNIQPKPGNVIFGGENALLAGDKTLEEKAGDLRFRLSAASFFQVNTGQLPRLWQALISSRQWSGKERVLELFSGAGTLSLPLARKAALVLGVESNAQAVEDAAFNAGLNKAGNVRFVCGLAEEALKQPQDGPPDIVVLDPPRKGLEPALRADLARSAPKEILYVSCDPASLARDLKELCQGGYVLDSVQPVDLFPQTFHVESVSRLIFK